MMNIERMIKIFEKTRIPYLVDNYLSIGSHDAIIAEWNKWWLDDTRGREKRIVRTPGMQATYRGNKRTTDIMFFKWDSKSKAYTVVGIAEIEKSRGRLVDKVKSLHYYKKARVNSQTGKKSQRFYRWQDLEFAILCTTVRRKPKGDTDELQMKEIRPAINLARKYSKESKMVWIIYLLEFIDVKTDYSDEEEVYFKEGGTRTLWYYQYKYSGKSHYYIIKNGIEKKVRLDGAVEG